MPCWAATRANCIPEDPAIRVLSRSKKAAPRLKASVPGDFDHDRVALTAAGADRGDAEASPAPTQLVHKRADDAGAGGTDRVAKGDRAAVDVDLALVDAEHPHRVEGERGEGLV